MGACGPLGQIAADFVEEGAEGVGVEDALFGIGPARRNEHPGDEAIGEQGRQAVWCVGALRGDIGDFLAQLLDVGLAETPLDGVDEVGPSLRLGIEPGDGRLHRQGRLFGVGGGGGIEEHLSDGFDHLGSIGQVGPLLEHVDFQVARALWSEFGRGGEEEAAAVAVLAPGNIGQCEVAERFEDDPVADVDGAGERLDLLVDRDSGGVEQEAVEVFVALAEEDLAGVELEPAFDAEADLVEVAADGGVGRALGT